MKFVLVLFICIIALLIIVSIIIVLLQNIYYTDKINNYNRKNEFQKEKTKESICHLVEINNYLYAELLNEVELFTELKQKGFNRYFLYLLKKEGLTSLEEIDNYKLSDWLLFYDKYKEFDLYPQDEDSLDTNLIDLFITILKKNYTNYDLTDEEESKLFDTNDFSKVYKELEKYKEEHNLTKKDEETEEYKEKKGAEENEDR